jgi:hypothetical protein
MAKAKPGYRIAIQLDPRIALETIILNRLERIPANRRQEWLRGLLVQGFRSECQALRGTPDDEERRPTTAYAHWMADKAKQSVSHTEPESAVVRAKPSQANPAKKPFAALSKVIG